MKVRKFKLYINNDVLTCGGTLAGYTGNVNTYRCVFNIQPAIEGLTWFCLFKQGQTIYRKVIVDGVCDVPFEVLESSGLVEIGCYAVNADGSEHKRISTNWVSIGIKKGAYSESTAPSIPTPDVWETLVGKTVPIIGENGNWYIYDIKKGKYIDSGVSASGSGDGHIPQKGVDYWTEDDKLEIINEVKEEIDFDEKIGGIEAALDKIIAIQNKLMGVSE